MDLFYLLLILVPPLVVPLWVCGCIAPALRAEVESRLRADLATTPTAAGDYLRGKLRARGMVAFVPAAIGLVTAALIAASTLIFGITPGGHYNDIDRALTFSGFVVGMATILCDRTATQSLWVSATKACKSGTEFGSLPATVRASARSVFMLVAFTFVIFGSMQLSAVMGSSSRRKEEMAAALFVATASILLCALAHWRERHAWRGLVAEYIVLDRSGSSRGASR